MLAPPQVRAIPATRVNRVGNDGLDLVTGIGEDADEPVQLALAGRAA